MAEKIYMIPVNDAFDTGSECPVCSMYQKLEDDAVDFMMGSAYMVDEPFHVLTDPVVPIWWTTSGSRRTKWASASRT